MSGCQNPIPPRRLAIRAGGALWFDGPVAEHDESPSVAMVRSFLRARNLEHVARVDEAIALYEAMLEQGFDAVGPYDRLIEIYSSRARHVEVVRVADAALAAVQTYPEKRQWYEQMKAAALRAAAAVPKATPKRPSGPTSTG